MKRVAIAIIALVVLVGGVIAIGKVPQSKSPTAVTSNKACSAGCSAADIVKHNSVSDCWVIYSGKVYDITTYTNQHPGGSSVYNAQTCGHDVTAYLQGDATAAGRSHSHSAKAYYTLAQFEIGTVK
jgi:cytochrome b involved in lipid metabolism